MANTRGSLADTTVISIRVDLLTAELIKEQAKAAKLTTSAYAQRILTNHTRYTDIGQDIKKDVQAALRYARTAYTEIEYLKQEIFALREKLDAIQSTDTV